jgi:hypothetical protein
MSDDEREALLALPGVRELLALEREACARLADDYVTDNLGGDSPESAAVWKAAGEIAADIRARGQS